MSELAELDTVPAFLAGLTAEQARDKLTELGEGDPESGHWDADELAVAALTAIRDGHEAPAELARDVLVVLSAEFPRWYA